MRQTPNNSCYQQPMRRWSIAVCSGGRGRLARRLDVVTVLLKARAVDRSRSRRPAAEADADRANAKHRIARRWSGVSMLWPEELSREAHMTSSDETGHITGTKDKDYNIIWFTEACLSDALRLETYIQDAD